MELLIFLNKGNSHVILDTPEGTYLPTYLLITPTTPDVLVACEKFHENLKSQGVPKPYAQCPRPSSGVTRFSWGET